MDDILEISELDLNDNNFGYENKSSNFGGGLELLMNDKVKDNFKPDSDINLEDLNNLEDELNNLVDDLPSSSFKPKSDLFGSSNYGSSNYGSSNYGTDDKQSSVRFNEHLQYFNLHKKKDDLSDSFLQGMWFINNKKC